MPESIVIQVRFSPEEIQEIESFMKNSKIKSQSDFIRISAGFLIAFIEAMTNLAKSAEVNSAVSQFNKELRAELDKVPPTKAKLRGKWKSFDKQLMPKYEAALEKGAKHAEPFAKKRKAGRPKKPKRKRGKPKDLGYEK